MKSFLLDIEVEALEWHPEDTTLFSFDYSFSSSSSDSYSSSSNESMESVQSQQQLFDDNNDENLNLNDIGENGIRNENNEGEAAINGVQRENLDQIGGIGLSSTTNRVQVQNEMNEHSLQRSILENLRSHPRSNEILFQVARCEELPLIRADIDWKALNEQLNTYPASEVGDDHGDILLQSILRMDPPVNIIEETIKLYPKSCVNMDAFYIACQYASDEAARIIMHRTIIARKGEGIQWGMLAFLGDARISIHHARLLLLSTPEAITDPEHGMFGISPLDRMLSGAFIHGDNVEWVEKLKLALFTAERGTLQATEGTNSGKRHFFPYHSLMKRLCSKDFKGVHFSALAFTNTIMACMTADSEAFLEADCDGNLPIHVALRSCCDTNLGLAGERKLLKTLFLAYPRTAVTPDCEGNLPLRLSIQNGWPCYDVITNAYPRAVQERNGRDGELSLHSVVSGTYHSRFGIGGARQIVTYFLAKYANAAKIQNSSGELPLHLAIVNGWPCHDLLVAAAPMALETRSVQSKLYPYQLAASVPDKMNGFGGLNILYELIRESPLMLHGLVPKECDRMQID